MGSWGNHSSARRTTTEVTPVAASVAASVAPSVAASVTASVATSVAAALIGVFAAITILGLVPVLAPALAPSSAPALVLARPASGPSLGPAARPAHRPATRFGAANDTVLDARRVFTSYNLHLPLLTRHALIGESDARIGLRLTEQPTDDWEPAMAPDGRWITYLARPAAGLLADSGARIRVRSASADGCDELLMLPAFDDIDLPVWDRVPGEHALLFAGLRRIGEEASTSPSQWDLYRVQLRVPALGEPGCPAVLGADEGPRQGALTNLTASPTIDEARPASSPDGRLLAFDHAPVILGADGERDHSAEGPDWDLGLIDSPTGMRRVLAPSDSNERKPSFSPDGRRIVFRSERSGRSQIYRVDIDGGGLARLTFTDGNDGYPTYSPDGRSILFESDKGASKGLYVMDAFGRGRQVLLSDDRLRFATPSWDTANDAILFSAGRPDAPLSVYRMRLPALAGGR